MKRILVTGAAGFIGSTLVDRLLARGDAVTGLDDFDPFYDPAIKRRNLAAASASPRFKLLEVDLRDRAAMHAALAAERPDAVVHLAAQAGVRPSIVKPQLYVDVNVTGTLNLLDAMTAAGCRRLVYGRTSPTARSPPTPRPSAPPSSCAPRGTRCTGCASRCCASSPSTDRASARRWRSTSSRASCWPASRSRASATARRCATTPTSTTSSTAS
jgi:nucleoside-diphosphate-sugar epimerase